MTEIARLDRTRPPPGYTLTPSCGMWVADESGALIREDESFDGEASAIAAAWAHYEVAHDPPGMWSRGGGRGDFASLGQFGVDGSNVSLVFNKYWTRKKARAAAWTWHWRRKDLADKLGAQAVVLVEHLGSGEQRRDPTSRANIVDTLMPMITMADDGDAREETIAEAERLFAEGRLTFEGDPVFEVLGIPGLELVGRCLPCAEPIEGEVDKCPDCGASLDNGNLVRGLEATGGVEDADA